jgi:hypothetical protein
MPAALEAEDSSTGFDGCESQRRAVCLRSTATKLRTKTKDEIRVRTSRVKFNIGAGRTALE